MNNSLTKLSLSASSLKRLLNWYPPFFGAGIQVAEIRENFRYAKVVMPLTWYNRNYVGVHFGGSLYSMCDPMYMLLLLNVLGRDFIVWDKAGSIEYLKPGTGRLWAEFCLEEDLIASLKQMEPDQKKVFDLVVDVKNEDGDVVARVVKTEYVKRKQRKLQ